MSLYNLVHGENPLAVILLGLLGLQREDVPRYRDCYWTGERIAVYTRTGGGNRESYSAENAAMCKLPAYDHDEDDDFDCTYATFFFRMPEQFTWVIPHLSAEDATPEQRWRGFLDKLSNGDKSDPQVKRVLVAMEPMIQQINDFLKGKNDA